MTKEELIMSLAEDITMVIILSIIGGLAVGWYLTYLYYHSHKDNRLEKANTPPQPEWEKRYRQVWRFMPVVQNIKILQHNADWMAKHGFIYQPTASNSGVLAFLKYEEEKEDTGPHDMTEDEVEELRREIEKAYQEQ